MNQSKKPKRMPAASRLQRIRKTILFFLLVAMPIIFAWMSPIVIIIAGFNRTVNMGMILFSAWFISSLFFGRAYCSYACFGAAGQELFGYLIKKPFRTGSPKKRRIARYIIFAIWLCAILIVPLLKGFSSLNPLFPNDPNSPGAYISIPREFSPGFIMYFGIQTLFFVVLPVFFGNRASCHYICPMSVLGDIGIRIRNLLRLPGLRMRADADLCTRCGKCSAACQMSLNVVQLVESRSMENPDCILCGECVNACPNKAIGFRWGRNRMEKKTTAVSSSSSSHTSTAAR